MLKKEAELISELEEDEVSMEVTDDEPKVTRKRKANQQSSKPKVSSIHVLLLGQKLYRMF